MSCAVRLKPSLPLREHFYRTRQEKKTPFTGLDKVYKLQKSKTDRTQKLTKDINSHKLFKCGVCFYCTRNNTNVIAHMRAHAGIKHQKCADCNFASTHKSLLRKHKESGCKTEDIIFLKEVPAKETFVAKSAEAGLSPISVKEIRRDNKAHFNNMDEFYKSQKDKNCKTDNNQKHTEDINSRKIFKCGVCYYCTRKKNNLIAHMRTHAGIKPHKCADCDFASTHKSLLRKHKESDCKKEYIIFLKEVPLKETFVAQNLEALISMKERIRDEINKSQKDKNCKTDNNQKLTGDINSRKLFKCGVCYYCTRKKNNLIAHMKTHAGTKPHKCADRDFALTHKRLLRKYKESECKKEDIMFLKEVPAKENFVAQNVETGLSSISVKEKAFQCDICMYSTSKINNLKAHSRIHSGCEPYICLYCESTFTHKSELRIHEITCKPGKVASDKGYGRCLESSFEAIGTIVQAKTIIPIKSAASKISDSKKTNTLFQCTFCMFSSYDDQKLKLHLVKHTTERPFKCEQCSYTGKTSRNLNCHIRGVHSIKSHRCELCSFSTSSKIYLTKHLSITHSSIRKFKCELCEYTGKTKTYLQKHTNLIHNIDRSFKCNKCKYSCNRKSKFASHYRIHTLEKPFKCDECSYASKLKSGLKSHKFLHTGEKPHKCHSCDYASSMKGTLKQHINNKHHV